MTAHDHTEVVPGCFRCELGRDEVEAEIECDYAGHVWADAGGGMQICVECQAERWDPSLSRATTEDER